MIRGNLVLRYEPLRQHPRFDFENICCTLTLFSVWFLTLIATTLNFNLLKGFQVPSIQFNTKPLVPNYYRESVPRRITFWKGLIFSAGSE